MSSAENPLNAFVFSNIAVPSCAWGEPCTEVRRYARGGLIAAVRIFARPRIAVPIDTPVPGGVLMRVMRPLPRLAAMRRASVAVILGLLLTVAACATSASQGHSPAAG